MSRPDNYIVSAILGIVSIILFFLSGCGEKKIENLSSSVFEMQDGSYLSEDKSDGAESLKKTGQSTENTNTETQPEMNPSSSLASSAPEKSTDSSKVSGVSNTSKVSDVSTKPYDGMDRIESAIREALK